MSTVEQREDGWWVIGLPAGTEPCGPYDTKAEAEDDRRGIERFFRDIDKPATFTVDWRQATENG